MPEGARSESSNGAGCSTGIEVPAAVARSTVGYLRSMAPASSPTRALTRTRTSTAIVDYVLEEIFEGRLRSGERIDLEEISRRLGVSRWSVREAMVVLERDGAVSAQYHRGFFVEPFDADSLVDIFEVMGLLSGVAVRRLAQDADQETIATLRDLLKQLKATDPADSDRIFELARAMLTVEHRAGGSRRLRAELRSASGFLMQALRVSPGRGHAQTVKAHSKVIRAIIAGEGDKAAAARLEDFRAAARGVVQELRRRGVVPGD